jgi:hypothetical protein
MTALHSPAAPPGLATPTGAWRKLSAAMTAEIPAIAGRPVPVACAPGAGLGHPACYLPTIPVIEVDGDLLGVSPATASPVSPADRERYPVLWGALTHEGGHAAHSKVCPPPAEKANWCQAAHLLEESRMEAAQVARRPGDRRWLRATVSKLILGDFTAAGATPGTPREAGSAAALILARETAGILEPAETAPVTAQVEKAVGADALKRLEATWKAAHQVADDDARAIVRLARRWCRILGLDPDAPPPAPVETGISDLLDAIRDAITAISAAVEADFTPPPPCPPGRAAERETENTARIDADRAAREVFARRTTPRAVTGTREPRDGEKAAARRFTRTLRDVTAGGRDTVTITSPVPPGRLRMRQVLAADAQRAAGARPTAEPFTRTRSRRVPAPPLRVGIACDISGSMEEFTGPVASAAWILARAAAALPAATTATVLYGEQVHPLTHPGHAPARVTDFAAPDGTEQLCKAIDALDGALGLSQPGTARLLAIVSDTYHTEPEIAGGQRRITRLAKTGCGVIILQPGDPSPWDEQHDWTDAQVITLTDPADTIEVIARAATRALTA